VGAACSVDVVVAAVEAIVHRADPALKLHPKGSKDTVELGASTTAAVAGQVELLINTWTVMKGRSPRGRRIRWSSEPLRQQRSPAKLNC
jgi:hypothetical protein